MKRTAYFVLRGLLFFGFLFNLLFLAGDVSAETFSTGWQCPAGSCNRGTDDKTGDWMGYSGHIGIDYMRSVNAPVFSLTHGVVAMYEPALSGYGSWCNDSNYYGGAMLIEHFAKNKDGVGRKFYAVYGHMYKRSNLNVGDIVYPGEIIGYVHKFYAQDCVSRVDHLHFGIRPDKIDPEKPFRGRCYSSGDCGWVNPTVFLSENYPANAAVDCGKLEDKFPDFFEKNGISNCSDASFIPPKQYSVTHYVYNGMYGYWGSEVLSFHVDQQPQVLGWSSSGSSSFVPPPTSTADNDGDSLVNTSANNISIREVKASIADKSNYLKEITLYTDELFDVRGWVKNKGTSGVRVNYQFFIDDDKTFNWNTGTHHYLGSEKNIYIGNGKTVYATQRDRKAPSEPGRHYVYLRAKITDGSDTDYSDRDIREQFGILNVIPRPVTASFSATPISGTAPLSVSFIDKSTGPVKSRNWNFGDGTSSSEANPVHVFSNPGTYVVMLTADNQGYTSSATVVVEVHKPPPYRYAYSTTCEDIQDHGNWFYSPINSKDSFLPGETIRYLAKLEDINVPHRLKLEIRHSQGWGWDEVWGWNDPGEGWSYQFFLTEISDPTPGIYSLKLSITQDDQLWKELSSIQSTVLSDNLSFQYIGAQTCEELVYHDAPLWIYDVIGPKSTFRLGEVINVIAEVTNISTDHRFKVEIWHNGVFWWANANESTPFREVDGTWGRSYTVVSQLAEQIGTFSFKIFLDTKDGFQFQEEIEAEVVP